MRPGSSRQGFSRRRRVGFGRTGSLALAAIAVLLAAGCSSRPKTGALAPRPVRTEREVSVVDAANAPVGALVETVIVDPAGDVRFWRVRNADGQWLGKVGMQGKVWRVEPFADQERFLGVLSVPEALEALFERDDLRLEPEDESVLETAGGAPQEERR